MICIPQLGITRTALAARPIFSSSHMENSVMLKINILEIINDLVQ